MHYFYYMKPSIGAICITVGFILFTTVWVVTGDEPVTFATFLKWFVKGILEIVVIFGIDWIINKAVSRKKVKTQS